MNDLMTNLSRTGNYPLTDPDFQFAQRNITAYIENQSMVKSESVVLTLEHFPPAFSDLTCKGKDVPDLQSEMGDLPPVTLEQVERAVDDILRFSGIITTGYLPLRAVESMPMEQMSVAIALTASKNFGEVANIKSQGAEYLTEYVKNIRLKQNEDLRNQIDKAIEDQQKAQKAGIFQCVVSWFTSIVQIVVGAVKCLVNPVEGVSDIVAGVTGLVKAAIETTILVKKSKGEDTTELEKAAEILGYIYMALQMVNIGVSAYGNTLKSGLNVAKNALILTANASSKIFSGVVNFERSELKKEIDELIADTNFMQYLLDAAESSKKRVRDSMKNLTDSAADAISGASESQTKTASNLVSIAVNIA